MYEECESQYSLKKQGKKIIINRKVFFVYIKPKEFGLQDSFEGWYNCTTLHCWMIHKKLAQEGELGKDLSQELTRHVWLDVEIKLNQAGVKKKISSIVSDLVSSYNGQFLAYDEGINLSKFCRYQRDDKLTKKGLYHGDPILAAALWRNLFICNKEISATQLYNALEHTRKRLQYLDNLPYEKLTEPKFFKFQ